MIGKSEWHWQRGGMPWKEFIDVLSLCLVMCVYLLSDDNIQFSSLSYYSNIMGLVKSDL